MQAIDDEIALGVGAVATGAVSLAVLACLAFLAWVSW